MGTSTEPEYLSITEVAARVGRSVNTVRRWDEAGHLRPRRRSPGRIRYYDPADVEAFLEREREAGAAGPKGASS